MKLFDEYQLIIQGQSQNRIKRKDAVNINI